MQHGILGPGGVGGLIGSVLAAANEDVTLIVRPGSENNYPRELWLDSKFGSVKAPVSIASKVERPLDVLWITVKATQLDQALDSVPDTLSVGAVVPLLNGIDHVAKLRERFGNTRVVPATIAVESERISPGRIVHRSPFARLSIAAAGWERLASAVEAFRRFGFDVRSVSDEQTLLWSKLVFLAPIALCTAAGRCPIGQVLEDPALYEELQGCVADACAVATAAGAKVDQSAVLGAIKALPAGMRSSMEKDVTNWRVPEIDSIGGPIVCGGETYGVDVRTTSALVARIKALGAGSGSAPI